MNIIKTEQTDSGKITQSKQLINNCKSKRCSDYEIDCADIENHLKCFMGGVFKTNCCGEIIEFDIADGYCPFVQRCN